MTIWAIVITGLVAIFTSINWRRGLLAVLLIGVLQDVFRKLTYGAPSYYVLWSTVVFGFMVLAAFAQRSLPPVSILFLRDPKVKLMLLAFLGLVILQSVNSTLRFSNPALAVLGGLFYVGPLVAMLVAAGFVDSRQRIRQFLTVYLWIFIPTCLTVFLSPSYADVAPIFRDVGTFIGQELFIYDVGTKLSSHPGILRVGELAAWHAATCIFFLSVLIFRSPNISTRVWMALLMVLMIGVIILTGRRKMLAAITIFFAIQWALLIWYRFGIRKMGVMLLALLVALAGVFLLYEPSEQSSYYLQRSQTVYESVGDRLELTWNLVDAAIQGSEFVGLGAGAASQGARFFGVSPKALGAAESGLGKIVVELSLFGFLLIVVLASRAALCVIRSLEKVRKLDSRLLVYQISFIAFLASNLAAFAIASQLFSDLFVLIILGTVAGFVVRTHNMAVDK